MDSIIRPDGSAAPLTASAVIDCIEAMRHRSDVYFVPMRQMTQWIMSDSTHALIRDFRKAMVHYRPRQRRAHPFGIKQRVRYLDLWEYNDD